MRTIINHAFSLNAAVFFIWALLALWGQNLEEAVMCASAATGWFTAHAYSRLWETARREQNEKGK